MNISSGRAPPTGLQERSTTGQRGVALIVVLLLIAILIPVITMLSVTTKTELEVSRSYRGTLENRAAIDSAVNLGRNYLLVDTISSGDTRTNFDAPSEQWAQPFQSRMFGGARVKFRIVDEARRVNLNWIVDQNGRASGEDPFYRQGKRLFDVLDLRQDLFKRLVEYLEISSDEDVSDRSGKKVLLSPEELLRVDGFTEDLLYGRDGQPALLRYVTVWPVTRPGSPRTDERQSEDRQTEMEQVRENQREEREEEGREIRKGYVNLNTASRPVLRTLVFENDEKEVVDLILSHRASGKEEQENRYFRSEEDLLALSNEGGDTRVLEKIAQRSRFRSEVFSVFVLSRSNGVTETARVVLDRPAGGEGKDEERIRILWYNTGIPLDVYDVFGRTTTSNRF